MKRDSERRRARRIPIEDVTVEVYDSNAHPVSVDICPIMNISKGGMLFETGAVYEDAQRLRLTFVLPDSIVIIRTDAQVVHKHRDKSLQYVGVSFHRLNPAEKRDIERFIKAREPN